MMMSEGLGNCTAGPGSSKTPPKRKANDCELVPWEKDISARQGLRIGDGSSGCLMINDLLLATQAATLISF